MNPLVQCAAWGNGPAGLTCVGLAVRRGHAVAYCPRCAQALRDREDVASQLKRITAAQYLRQLADRFDDMEAELGADALNIMGASLMEMAASTAHAAGIGMERFASFARNAWIAGEPRKRPKKTEPN